MLSSFLLGFLLNGLICSPALMSSSRVALQFNGHYLMAAVWWMAMASDGCVQVFHLLLNGHSSIVAPQWLLCATRQSFFNGYFSVTLLMRRSRPGLLSAAWQTFLSGCSSMVTIRCLTVVLQLPLFNGRYPLCSTVVICGSAAVTWPLHFFGCSPPSMFYGQRVLLFNSTTAVTWTSFDGYP